MFQAMQLFSRQKLIDVGYDIYSHEKRSIFDRHLGDMWLIAAMTAYGKTLLVRNLMTQLSDRRIIGFDSRKEHLNLKRMNCINIDGKGDCIPDLLYIDEFGFKLKDFTNPVDWENAGLNPSGARICANAAEKVARHKNDFEKFMSLINEVPTKGSNAEFHSTMLSVKSKLKSIRRNFVDEHAVDITYSDADRIRYTENPFYISDWKYFVRKHNHLCINFNSENNPAKAQLFAGKIMNEIKTILKPNEPTTIFMEESHFLYPSVISEDNVPYSSSMVYHYAKVKHKDAVKLVLITQYPHQLNESALDEVKWFFIGKLENIKGYSKLDELFRMTSRLDYNPLINYREWLCYSPAYNEKFIFKGFDSFTHYEKRK